MNSAYITLMHTHTHACTLHMNRCAHVTHTYTNIQIHMCTHIHTCTHVNACACILHILRKNKYIMYTMLHTQVHTCTHTSIHMHTHTYTCIHTISHLVPSKGGGHTHTHTRIHTISHLVPSTSIEGGGHTNTHHAHTLTLLLPYSYSSVKGASGKHLPKLWVSPSHSPY